MIRNDPFIGSRNVYDIVVSGGVKASFGSRRDQWNRGDPWFVDGFGHGIFNIKIDCFFRTKKGMMK